MSHGDTIPLHPSSQSDIDEIENLIYDSVQSDQVTVLPARPPSPPRASIPVSSSPFINSNIPPPSYQKATASAPSKQPVPAVLPVSSADFSAPSGGDARQGISSDAFGSPANTLTEPVWDTVKRDLSRIVNNLKLVVFPNPYREDPGKALRDWDLWGPFFFIVFLGLALSWSASVKKGGHIIFFQSLSLLGYCLFPLDVGALICLIKDNVILKVIIVSVTLAWSSWAAYPFMSAAVNPRRKALALYPVFLMYVSVGFLIIAID
ncbi:hypothetical protein KFK09_007130 [Dendrobium nobile]|uniref:Protein YIP n=1 Tax=Dendrobium nobile TaxID=94219 RepID=A0A8T3BR36_DENNO|nr:hypothetical protein KFK09_007130 [Dendrobium nobile]